MRFNYWQTFHENEFYHIYNRAVGNDWLFINDGHYRFFLSKWQQRIHPYMDTYAYCLMSNHFHFLARVKPITESLLDSVRTENTVATQRFLTNEISFDAFLEDQFKRFFSAYTLAFNKQQKRHGSLFQASFKRVQLKSNVKILNTLCYIHHNPIHHDISPFYEVWKYSSFNTYLSDKNTSLARREGLALFGGDGIDIKAFLHYHEAYQMDKLRWKKGLDWEDNMGDFTLGKL